MLFDRGVDRLAASSFRGGAHGGDAYLNQGVEQTQPFWCLTICFLERGHLYFRMSTATVRVAHLMAVLGREKSLSSLRTVESSLPGPNELLQACHSENAQCPNPPESQFTLCCDQIFRNLDASTTGPSIWTTASTERAAITSSGQIFFFRYYLT